MKKPEDKGETRSATVSLKFNDKEQLFVLAADEHVCRAMLVIEVTPEFKTTEWVIYRADDTFSLHATCLRVSDMRALANLLEQMKNLFHNRSWLSFLSENCSTT